MPAATVLSTDLSAHHSTQGSAQRLSRYLLINPNTNAATTERLQHTLQPHLPQGVTLEVCTARFGARYIACEASYAVAGHACLDAWAQHRLAHPSPYDGVLIGCFGDPGLWALREVCAAPVTGLAEASFMQAAQHGAFAIVTGGERWKPMLLRLAHCLGFQDQLRHIETVAPSGAVLQANPTMALECLAQACQNAAQAGVQSIILGGAGLAGYAQALQAQCPLPLIDSALASLHSLLQGQAPPPPHATRATHAPHPTDGTYAQWSAMSEAWMQLDMRPEG